MTEPTPDPAPAQETWTFGGTRVANDNKPYSVWYDEDGKALWFKADRKHAVGARYRVEVTRRDDGGLTRHGTPAYLGTADAGYRAELWAAHTAAEVLDQQRRDEANARKADALNEALAPLLRLVVAERTSRGRDALVATILRRMLGHH